MTIAPNIYNPRYYTFKFNLNPSKCVNYKHCELVCGLLFIKFFGKPRIGYYVIMLLMKEILVVSNSM